METTTKVNSVDRFLGMMFFLTFFGMWMSGAGIGFFALIETSVNGTYYLAAFIVAYFSYRYLFPAKPWEFFLRCTSSWCKKYPYFKVQRVVFDKDVSPIKPNSKSLLCCHPHGILCCGWTMLGNDPSMVGSGMHWLVANMMTRLPFISDFIRWLSGGPAIKSYMIQAMKKNQNLALLPGGFEEATIFSKDHHRIFIKNRKGFLKYALQHGYSIYPAYFFGEEATYHTVNYAMNWCLWLNKYKIPTVLFYGAWWCFFLPLGDVELTTVIGQPIQLPQVDSPTDDQVDEYHKIYVTAVQTLFEKYKTKYATNPNAKLEIF